MGQRLNDRDGLCLCALAALESGTYRLPMALDGRAFRGDINVRIDTTGTWHYNDCAIDNPDLVSAFASMLKRSDDGLYWLVTPTEMGRIEVEDAPLIAVDHCLFGFADKQRLSLLANSGRVIYVSAQTPLVTRATPNGSPRAYVVDADGIEVRLSPAVHTALLASAVCNSADTQFHAGVWSDGVFFSLGHTRKADA